MKLISRNTDYALRAVCYIALKKRAGANDGGVVTVTELVRALKIPRPFLRKILQSLNKSGILRSSKGVGGGFVLALGPEEIRLSDLMAVFQGPFRLNECTLNRKACPNRNICALKKEIDGIEDIVHARLKGITIRSILGK